MKTNLREYIEHSGVKDLKSCLCRVPIAPRVEDDRPLFFYHLHKTGGLAVHTALQASQVIQTRQMPPETYFYFVVNENFNDDLVRRNPEPIQRSHYVSYAGTVGVRTFGTHRIIDKNWRLMTVLRDPFDRLVSHYFYEVRRGYISQHVTEENFLEYARDWKNVCFYSRMLHSGSDEKSNLRDVYEEARENLSTFDFADTLENLETLMLKVWSLYKLPPVITQHIHKNPHRDDRFEYLRDDIYELNKYDCDLYEMVRQNPQSPVEIAEDAGGDTGQHDAVAVITDAQNNQAASFPVSYLTFDGFIELIQREDVKSLQDLYRLTSG